MAATGKNTQVTALQETSYRGQEHLPLRRSQNLLHRAKRQLHRLLKSVPYSLVT
jgi:hypothetical protein